MFFQKQSRSIYSPLLQQLSINEFDTLSEVALQEICLQKIKVQRQKIEELTKIYQMQKETVKAKNDQIIKLKQTIEQLELDRNYQQAYEQLKINYQESMQQLQISKFESDKRIDSQKSLIQQLMGEIQDRKQAEKTLIYQMSMLQKHWTNLLNSREEEIMKIKQDSTEKITELKFKNKQLEDQLTELKQLYSIKQEQRKSTERSLRKSSKAKQIELEKVKKTLKKTESQCSRYRLQSSSMQNSWKYEREELNTDIQTLNMCIKSLRKELTQKIVEVESLKESLKRESRKGMVLEQRSKNMMKEFQKQLSHQKQVKVRRQTQGIQTKKLQVQIERLRKQNVKHVEDYNILQIEYNRLKMELQKKESSWKVSNKLSIKTDCYG